MNDAKPDVQHSYVEKIEADLAALRAQRDALRAALEDLHRFTFAERWAAKGFDSRAQAIYDKSSAALAGAKP